MKSYYDLNDATRNEQKTRDVKYRLGKLVLLNFYDLEMLTEEQFKELRDKLIEKYQPTIGELERGAPWVRNEFDE